MLKGKKGLFEIEDYVSVMIYTIVLFMFLIILSLPQCSPNPGIQGLSSEAKSVDRLNNGNELLDMLKMRIPDSLPQLIKTGKTIEIGRISLYWDVDVDDASDFLTRNPGAYESKTYAEFIDELQFRVGDDELRNDVFELVTRAVFVRPEYPPHVLEVAPESQKLLIYPEVYVKYGQAGQFLMGDADLSNALPGGTRPETVMAFVPLTSNELAPKPKIATVMRATTKQVNGI